MYKSKKVLVTGGTGMIGRELVRMLLERGSKVRVASLDDPSRAPAGTEFVRGNLMEWEFCKKIVEGIDFVFHVAGIKGSVGIGKTRAASFFVPHLLMNTSMMEAARQAGVERYLYTSSIGVYPPAERFYEDKGWDAAPHHTDLYAGWAKRMGELQAETYKIEFGWDKIAIVRPANVYGPGDNFNPQTAMVIPALMARLVSGEDPFVVWGDGSAVRDFIYAADVAEGMLLALEKAATCTPINLGSGTGVRIRDLVETLVSLADKKPKVVWDASKQGGEPVRILDMARAEKLLGYKPRTTLREGLKKTLDWYLANRQANQGRYSVFEEKTFLR